MTKLETIAYYEALNASNRLIIIDSKDTKDEISDKLIDKKECIGTVHIEMFHNNCSMYSYSLIRIDNGSYDLWTNRQKKMDKKPLDKIAKYLFCSS